MVVAQTVSHYGLWISLALVAVIVVAQVRSQRHMMRVAAEARASQGEARASQGEARASQGEARASQSEVPAEGQVAGGDTPVG